MPTIEKSPPNVRSQVPPRPPRAARKWSSRITQAAANCCAILVLIGLVDRFTVRDSVDLLAPIFYALPPAVLAVLSLYAMIAFALKRQRKRFLLFLLVAVGCLAYWTRTEFRRPSASPEQGDVPVFLWNASSNLIPQPSVDLLHQSNADIIGMVEAGDSRATLEWYAAELPSYHFAHFGEGLVIGAHGRVSNRTLGDLGGFGKFASAEIELDRSPGKAMTVIVVDINSDPLRSRRPAFEALQKIIEEQGDRPIMVMGDFNTPGDSACFDSMRAQFRDAFETAGESWSSTWPIPAPVMALDHIWFSKHFSIAHSKLGWATTSDHRSVLTKVSLSGN